MRWGDFVNGFGFLKWAFLSLGFLVVANAWFELTCEHEELSLLHSTLAQWTTDGTRPPVPSGMDYLRFIAASKMSLAVSFALVASSFAVIVFSTYTLWRRLSRPDLILALVISALIAAFSIGWHYQGTSCLNGWYFTPWYQSTQLVAQHVPLTPVYIRDILVVTTNVSVALLIVAVASLHKARRHSGLRSDTIHRLADELYQFRRLLYAGAIQFTVGVFAIFYGLYVNTAAIGKEQKSLLVELISNLTFTYGVTYTMLLVTAFYPSFVSIRMRALTVALESEPEGNPYEFLTKRGFDIANFGVIKEFIVVLGPLLASTTASVLKLH